MTSNDPARIALEEIRDAAADIRHALTRSLDSHATLAWIEQRAAEALRELEKQPKGERQ